MFINCKMLLLFVFVNSSKLYAIHIMFSGASVLCLLQPCGVIFSDRSSSPRSDHIPFSSFLLLCIVYVF